MKKVYMQPAAEAVELETAHLICASLTSANGVDVDGWNTDNDDDAYEVK